MWSGEDPIGKRLREYRSRKPWAEVVGVARHVKYISLTEPPRGMYYAPLAQHADAPVTIVARTTADPAALLKPIGGILAALDPNMPVYDVQTIDRTLCNAADKLRAAAALLSVLGVLAMTLATVGVYGVAAHAASTRTREVGVRMALGANAWDIVRLFLGEVLWLAGLAAVAGLTLSALASQWLESFLVGLAPTDAVTFVGSAVMLLVVTAIASAIPARRAARADPLQALRSE